MLNRSGYAHHSRLAATFFEPNNMPPTYETMQ
jgi:hypothetical protein